MFRIKILAAILCDLTSHMISEAGNALASCRFLRWWNNGRCILEQCQISLPEVSGLSQGVAPPWLSLHIKDGNLIYISSTSLDMICWSYNYAFKFYTENESLYLWTRKSRHDLFQIPSIIYQKLYWFVIPSFLMQGNTTYCSS